MASGLTSTIENSSYLVPATAKAIMALAPPAIAAKLGVSAYNAAKGS